jgi:hypothetical protein
LAATVYLEDGTWNDFFSSRETKKLQTKDLPAWAGGELAQAAQQESRMALVCSMVSKIQQPLGGKECIQMTTGSMLKFSARAIAFATLSLAFVACETRNETYEMSAEPLYGGPGVQYWNSSTGRGTPATVPVCLGHGALLGLDAENNEVSSIVPNFVPMTTLAQWARSAAENGWGRVANITFTGWNEECAHVPGWHDGSDRDVNPGKVMFALNPGDYCDFYGRSSSMGNMIRASYYTASEAGYRTILNHEMGHALGFAHEMDRPDNYIDGVAQVCTRGAEGPAPGGEPLNLNRVDKQSTMCYDTLGDLSPDDIVGVQLLYGRKPSGSLVGDHGNCAQLSSTSPYVLSADCQSEGTKWYSEALVEGWHQIRSASDPTKCWSDANGMIRPDSCSGTTSFHFPLLNMLWRGFGNMCVSASSSSVGSPLHIAACGSEANQRWDFMLPVTYSGGQQVGMIRLNNTNLCVAAPNYPPNVGDPFVLQDCNLVPNQTFHLARGTQSIYFANLCANVFGPYPNAGAGVGLWDACGAINSLFHMSGSLVSGLGNCAVLPVDRGGGVTTQPCDGQPYQEWDYYW